MTAKEMFELAKAGYKPNEIAEMHKLMKDADPEKETKEESKAEPKPRPKEEPKAEPEPQPKEEPKAEPEPQPKEEPKSEPEKDYRLLYEESQKQLAAAQKQYLSQNLGGNDPKDEDILADLVRGFM